MIGGLLHGANEFLRSLTIVLAVAAVTTVVFQRLRLPVVLGYILAGLIVGPHVPVPIVANEDIVHTLSELGVILLMFSLGLEFSLRKLARVGPAAFTAVIQSGIMVWLGFLLGRLFGWTVLESVFAGAVIAVSSTTIIAKVFDEQKIGGRLREFVVGILLVEDLIAIVFLAALTAIASGSGLSFGALGKTVGQLAMFLAALLAAGMLFVPRFIRFVVAIGRPETTLVASIGVCFGTAWVAQQAGYSVALGAFLAGSLVAESGCAETIEHLVQPVRDMFAAIFFVSVGMLIVPSLAVEHWRAIAALTAAVIVGKTASVTLAAFLVGTGTRTSIQAGMSLSQIGEFSFIIAGVGLALGATGDFLYPVAVAVSAITTLTTPWLIRVSGPFAAWADRKLPRPLQTFATLYGTWLERLRAGPTERRPDGVRLWIRWLVVDTLALSALIIAVSTGASAAGNWLREHYAVTPRVALVIVYAVSGLIAVPLLVGIGRLSTRLGRALGTTALPRAASGKTDLEAVPRQAFVLTLELGVALIAGSVVLAITQPFLPTYAGLVVLGGLLLGFGIAIWRRATELEGHVQAGSQAVMEALASYTRSERDEPAPIAVVQALLPGLGAPVALQLRDGHPAIGKTLSELNLRGRTGATVLAISRPGGSIAVPAATERLLAGDVVALAGTADAIDAARSVLCG